MSVALVKQDESLSHQGLQDEARVYVHQLGPDVEEPGKVTHLEGGHLIGGKVDRTVHKDLEEVWIVPQVVKGEFPFVQEVQKVVGGVKTLADHFTLNVLHPINYAKEY